MISGQRANAIEHAKEITENLNCIFLEDQKKASTFLGQEFDAVIFDCHDSFDPNAFGAITGTIRGGGYLLLLKSNNAPQESLFLKRFWGLLEDTAIFYQADGETQNTKKNTDKLVVPSKITHASLDQNEAVAKIIHVVKGHRRRPLIITADRGRGKSAALGIAAAELFDDGYKNIIVCAPSKKTAEILFKHALNTSPKCTLSFYSPDELQQQKPQADLVLIDEAAAIPISLLTQFLHHYSRIVFATTQHGYEGSGRGFSIRFKKVLDDVSPEWVSCQLTKPIRWSDNDSLEAFVFEALLLKAEPAQITTVDSKKCINSTLNKSTLLQNKAKLLQLFGLLVSAHYQTKPSDLMHMLDDDQVSIHVTEHQENIIAVALLIKEGDINSKTATAIFEGSRRLKGHLVAQSLAANIGIEQAPCLKGERINRIAVHPNLQQQGFGGALVTALIKHSNADYLSTSFGATSELLSFWGALKFTPVYLGMKRDASSGAHSVILLSAKTKQGIALLKDAQQRFTKSFPHLLSGPFQELETAVATTLLLPLPLPQEQELSTSSASNSNTKRELEAFAHKQRGFENTLYPLWTLVCGNLAHAKLKKDEEKIIVLKVLQKHSWKSAAEKMGGEIHGKKDALSLLRKAISKLLI